MINLISRSVVVVVGSVDERSNGEREFCTHVEKEETNAPAGTAGAGSLKIGADGRLACGHILLQFHPGAARLLAHDAGAVLGRV